MTDDQETVLVIRGAITQLPKEQQERITKFYESFKKSVEEDAMASYAIALLGAELAASAGDGDDDDY